jgi:hypothetical protein
MLFKTDLVELETMGEGIFLKLGQKEMWLERSGYKPKGMFEVIREDSETLHVFLWGRALTLCCPKTGTT